MIMTKKEPSKTLSTNNSRDIKEKNLTRIIVHYDVGFNNNLFIRGSGVGLSWNKGILLRNTRPDEWVWETKESFLTCEFKVLINDSHYEEGENHTLTCHSCVEYIPRFF
jgi:hypothetical protein